MVEYKGIYCDGKYWKSKSEIRRFKKEQIKALKNEVENYINKKETLLKEIADLESSIQVLKNKLEGII